MKVSQISLLLFYKPQSKGIP